MHGNYRAFASESNHPLPGPWVNARQRRQRSRTDYIAFSMPPAPKGQLVWARSTAKGNEHRVLPNFKALNFDQFSVHAELFFVTGLEGVAVDECQLPVLCL